MPEGMRHPVGHRLKIVDHLTHTGPLPEEAGSLLELTQGGRQPIRLSSGETRAFLEDGDTVILRASASATDTAALASASAAAP